MTRASVALRALMQVCARACVRAGVGGRVGVRCQCVGVGVRVHIRVCSRCLSLGRLGRPTRAGGCASSHAPQHACDSASASEGTEPHMDVDMERARDGGSGCAGRREGRCPEEGIHCTEREGGPRGGRGQNASTPIRRDEGVAVGERAAVACGRRAEGRGLRRVRVCGIACGKLRTAPFPRQRCGMSSWSCAGELLRRGPRVSSARTAPGDRGWGRDRSPARRAWDVTRVTCVPPTQPSADACCRGAV